MIFNKSPSYVRRTEQLGVKYHIRDVRIWNNYRELVWIGFILGIGFNVSTVLFKLFLFKLFVLKPKK